MSKLLVAAIDFGTTYSGYGFSFRHDFESNPLKISLNQWASGTGRLLTEKTPTCVLFNPDGEFDSFGFEAEEKYGNLALDEEHKPWYYFRRFKMGLYDQQGISRRYRIEEEGTKKTMDAMKVFTASIKYLKDHMISNCANQLVRIQEDEIYWVLTVPAIWSDPAKKFMREAAENAGISTDRLKIALEPEAAALFCKYLPIEKRGDTFQPGSKYMVIDAGGGTIDITVHEVQTNKTLKELYKANGGPWGGVRVDEALRDLLADIVGTDIMEKFSLSQKIDEIDLFRDFEIKKKTIKPDTKDMVTFKVPTALVNLFSETKNKNISTVVESNKKYKGKLKWVGDKLRMEANITQGLFEESCDKIVDHVQSIFRDKKVKEIKTILLVGGYAESPMLQESMQKKFGHLKIIIPQEAGLSVLKGAVIFGHEPDAISTRKCKYTYGVDNTEIFDPKLHPAEKKIVINGKDRCDDIFSTHVIVGQEIHVGESQVSQRYGVLKPNQTTMLFNLYASTIQNPKFVTDISCQHLGKFTIELPDTTKGLDRHVEVNLTFSGTEIEVTATDIDTGRSVKTVVDFLG
ncbi:heat shock 70 kDa protein 12B-like isoform X2 [Ostrea edulis]|nr:heat shock 70 kDa protein 12B-like isoform X2 [Ostrea edulis]XP_056014932.1 heat shock 70 kDa protein 12B-like isoform X2 [Ostrea edulis]